jgi:single-stranded-DNA-specific exonuclease
MKWILTESNEEASSELAQAAGLHPLVARLMVNRGITDPAAALSFLTCDLSTLSDPRIFRDMERAVRRIRDALARKEKIVVYGDYDVDGITASTLLTLVLRGLGAVVDWYIPDRMSEGYGLNAGALEMFKGSGTGLVITVDCGISALHEAEQARSLGIDLIITDHHELPGGRNDSGEEREAGQVGRSAPAAYAVIHPLLLAPDVPEPVASSVAGLTGVGVAFKLAQALLDTGAGDAGVLHYLDLVTLGTVADMGSLTGENRVLVKHGLEALSSASAQRPGVAALKAVAGLTGKKVGVGTVGFSLAPRINASGRLENASAAFRLLSTESSSEAAELAEMLDAMNRERRSIEDVIWEDARRMCLHKDIPSTGALVLASEKWHPGVIGIVASRIAEEFYRPTALISLQDGIGKGSARSVPGFDLYRALVQCADLLLGYGGHRYAAGFTVDQGRIEELSARLDAVARERAGADGFVRTLRIDGSVSLAELGRELVEEIERLAPFGQGNPEPRLGARGLEVISSRIVGAKHLKLRVRQGEGQPIDAIAFSRAGLHGKIARNGNRVAAVFTPRVNTWNNRTAVELEVRDLKADKA